MYRIASNINNIAHKGMSKAHAVVAELADQVDRSVDMGEREYFEDDLIHDGKERDGLEAERDQIELYKGMLVDFQMDQAKWTKEYQAALHEKDTQLRKWQALYEEREGPEKAAEKQAEAAEDEVSRLSGQVTLLEGTNAAWESRLKEVVAEKTELLGTISRQETSIKQEMRRVEQLERSLSDKAALLAEARARGAGLGQEQAEQQGTIDGLVDEYTQLTAEYQEQRERDAAQREADLQKLRKLSNLRDELQMKLKDREAHVALLLDEAQALQAGQGGGGARSGDVDIAEAIKPFQEKVKELVQELSASKKASALLSEEVKELKSKQSSGSGSGSGDSAPPPPPSSEASEETLQLREEVSRLKEAAAAALLKAEASDAAADTDKKERGLKLEEGEGLRAELEEKLTEAERQREQMKDSNASEVEALRKELSEAREEAAQQLERALGGKDAAAKEMEAAMKEVEEGKREEGLKALSAQKEEEKEKALSELTAEKEGEKDKALAELTTAKEDEKDKALTEQAAKKEEEKEKALSELTTQKDEEKEKALTEQAATKEEEKEKALTELTTQKDEEKEKALTELTTMKEEEKEKALTELTTAKDEEKEKALSELTTDKEEEKEKALSEQAATKEGEKEIALTALTEEMTSGLEALGLEKDEERAAALKELQEEKDEELKEAKAREDKAKEELENVEVRWRALQEKALLEQEKKLNKEKEAAVAVVAAERDEASALYAKENRARKDIHNKLMELQGNIRVMARVRPLVEAERRSGQAKEVMDFPSEEDVVVHRDEATKSKFEFDRVFTPTSKQEEVFASIKPLISSVLHGYNVCIFAYGQTGSGKTFTMEGSEEDPGVNVRALTSLFKGAQEDQDDVEYSFTISMMEIYNETVRDLLVPGGTTGEKLDIRQSPTGTVVPGLTEVSVSSIEEVNVQLEQGRSGRAVGSHDMNEHSSRSHMIFRVMVTGVNRHNNTNIRSKLHLIDLAGSERISKTDATGDRLKEAQNINRSLSALGDVIAALSSSKKGGHVPYRNSKLTFLLQDSLSGNSKVMMFVNASPAEYNVGETVCSLTFASRCRAVELGGAKKNVDSLEVGKYRRAIDSLQAQLVAAGITPTTGPPSTPGGGGGASATASPGGAGSGPSSSGSASGSGGSGGAATGTPTPGMTRRGSGSLTPGAPAGRKTLK